MAEYTENLGLLKKDPVADANDTFNIQTMLNDNWDKVDNAASNACKITTGSYVGTGCTTEFVTLRLPFDFPVKLIIVLGASASGVMAIILPSSGFGFSNFDTSYGEIAFPITIEGNDILLAPMNAYSEHKWLNEQGTTFHYVAFG